MPRDAVLFDQTFGSAVEGYLRLRQEGKNLPPSWIKRSKASRKRREKAFAAALKKNSLDALPLLRDWEIAYRKECFYHGIRVLFDLQREGTSRL